MTDSTNSEANADYLKLRVKKLEEEITSLKALKLVRMITYNVCLYLTSHVCSPSQKQEGEYQDKISVFVSQIQTQKEQIK